MQLVICIRSRLEILHTHNSSIINKRSIYVRSLRNIIIIVSSTGKHVLVVKIRVCVCTTTEKSEARVVYIVKLT